MADKAKDEEFSLTLTGFKSKAQVKAFIDWYEGQGEQDIPVWLECQEGMPEYMNVDVHTKYKWDGNNLTARLDIDPPKSVE